VACRLEVASPNLHRFSGSNSKQKGRPASRPFPT
jgi:hypothetical protein